MMLLLCVVLAARHGAVAITFITVAPTARVVVVAYLAVINLLAIVNLALAAPCYCRHLLVPSGCRGKGAERQRLGVLGVHCRHALCAYNCIHN